MRIILQLFMFKNTLNFNTIHIYDLSYIFIKNNEVFSTSGMHSVLNYSTIFSKFMSLVFREKIFGFKSKLSYRRKFN